MAAVSAVYDILCQSKPVAVLVHDFGGYSRAPAVAVAVTARFLAQNCTSGSSQSDFGVGSGERSAFSSANAGSSSEDFVLAALGKVQAAWPRTAICNAYAALAGIPMIKRSTSSAHDKAISLDPSRSLCAWHCKVSSDDGPDGVVNGSGSSSGRKKGDSLRDVVAKHQEGGSSTETSDDDGDGQSIAFSAIRSDHSRKGASEMLANGCRARDERKAALWVGGLRRDDVKLTITDDQREQIVDACDLPLDYRYLVDGTPLVRSGYRVYYKSVWRGLRSLVLGPRHNQRWNALTMVPVFWWDFTSS